MKLAQSSYRLRLLLVTSLAILALLLPTVAYAAPIGTPVESASQHGGCSTIHVVQPGDTLSEIAKWYGVSMGAIMSANNISNPNHVWVGQRLCIPAGGGGDWGGGGGGDWGGGGSWGQGCSAWHTVRFGETLSGIARWYGVSVQSIMSANGISNPNRIFVGQQLCIPAGGGGGGCNPCAPTNPCNPCWPQQPVNPCNPCVPVQPTPLPPPQCNPCGPVQPLPPPQCNPCGPVQPVPPVCNPCWPVQPTPIPPTPVPPQPTGPWGAEFYNNANLSGSPSWTTSFQQIGFNWGTGGPGGGINGNQFSARFQQNVFLPAGTYRFYATSDDGVRVYVNNQLVINGWIVQSATTYYGDVALPEGTQNLRVEYFQNGGDALLYVSYQRIY